MGRPMTRIKLPYIHEYRDRKGRMRRYVRRPGYPKMTLPGLPGSPEFMQVYKDALAGAVAPKGRSYKPGSLGDLVTQYYGSATFSNLSPKSQAIYRGALSTHVERDGHRLVRDLNYKIAAKIIQEIGATRPGMANLTRSIMVAIFDHAIRLEMRADNPFKYVETYRLGTRHTWTDAELATFEKRWPLGTRERLAYAVLLYSGQRVSDAVKLKRSDVMTFTQKKTGADMSIPVHPALARAVKAGPSNGVYIIGDERGRPIISETLTRLITRAVKDAGLPAACKAHGLRKAIMRRLAEKGATTKQMMSVSGHTTLKEVERYSAKADQSILSAAAIALLPDESGT